MLTEELREQVAKKLAAEQHPRECAIDVMYILQSYYGYLSDEALREGAGILGMTPLELEELATFYDFIYRKPVGRFVIHVCDGCVCWMLGNRKVVDYLKQKLGIGPGETTPDAMFTILPVACIGDCDHAPAILVNGVPHGPMTPERIDEIIHTLKTEPCSIVICR
jgi:NADH-quinone oxidoreductase subunit E